MSNSLHSVGSHPQPAFERVPIRVNNGDSLSSPVELVASRPGLRVEIERIEIQIAECSDTFIVFGISEEGGESLATISTSISAAGHGREVSEKIMSSASGKRILISKIAGGTDAVVYANGVARYI